MNRSTLAAALVTSALSGCALTPGQVIESAPLARASLAIDLPELAPCLLAGMDEITPSWTTSQRTDGGGVSFRLHGHADTGTMAVARARRSAGRTELFVHVSESIFPRQSLADKIKATAEACDRR